MKMISYDCCLNTWPGNNHLGQNVPICDSPYSPTVRLPSIPGTPVGEPLITLLCGLILQMGGVGCIRLVIVLIIS